MVPLTVTAHLASPPVVDRPVYLDGVLLAGLGAMVGDVDDAAVVAFAESGGLPLARVDTPHGWWWAASAVQPWGREERDHLNRVPLVEEAGRWTTARSVTQGSGPDKRLRVPHYSRPAMLRLAWACVGDPEAVGRLLARVPSVGRLTTHGHGWVTRWVVERGGPPLDAYASSVALRHLPVEVAADLPDTVSRRLLPLRPPYHARRNAVPCWQAHP